MTLPIPTPDPRRRRPIAVATPTLDPAAVARATLRRQIHAVTEHKRLMVRHRRALVDAIHQARDAGLSYRQIGATVDLPTMTVQRLDNEQGTDQ